MDRLVIIIRGYSYDNELPSDKQCIKNYNDYFSSGAWDSHEIIIMEEPLGIDLDNFITKNKPWPWLSCFQRCNTLEIFMNNLV